MSRQHHTRTSSQKSSSGKEQTRFIAPPVIQPKAVTKPKAELPEWKPGGSGVNPLARLQETAAIQAKLTIGQPNDRYEQEADRVARNVVQRINSPVSDTPQQEETVQRETEDRLQTKPLLQRQEAVGGGEASSELESSIDRAKSGGQSLDSGLQQSMGQAMGADFSNVKVHTDTRADQLNQSIQAKAFTTGQDVFFRQGAYQPGNQSGQELIAHELTHVVQQNGSNVQRWSEQQDEGISKNSVETLSTDSRDSELIQRRIGFEVETGIPIVEKVDDPTRLVDNNNTFEWHECYPDDMGETVQYNQMVVSADLAPEHTETSTEPFDQWSIIEMVTKPIDDNMTVNNFDTIARNWLTKLIALKQNAQTSPPAYKIPATPYYVGLPSNQNYSSWDRIAPQVTTGIPLHKAASLLSSFDHNDHSTTQAREATKRGNEAPGIAQKIVQHLISEVPPGTHTGVAELKGLITMICAYLLIGGDNYANRMIYRKNRPTNIFVKSKLSDVANNINTVGYAQQILSNATYRQLLKTLILVVTKRKANQGVFLAYEPVGDDLMWLRMAPLSDRAQQLSRMTASNTQVGTWISDVLRGHDDALFDELKNPWSDKITPDANNEVVIELRKRAFNLQHNNYTLDDFNGGLLEYLKKVYLANKAFKYQ